ncbi:MAG: hypothetical protein PVI23_12360, partial [Maricaulaceae bacterium]
QCEGKESVDDVEPLIAASASIYKSLECAVRAFEATGRPVSDWRIARARLGAALRSRKAVPWSPHAGHAMDWYYPVLAGVVRGAAARTRLARSWRVFVRRGQPGCRCVADEPWTTAAETAELAMALAAAGAPGLARKALLSLGRMRAPDGDAWMGWQHVEALPWPLERPSWTAGAALIADDVVRAASPAAAVWLKTLPETTS